MAFLKSLILGLVDKWVVRGWSFLKSWWSKRSRVSKKEDEIDHWKKEFQRLTAEINEYRKRGEIPPKKLREERLNAHRNMVSHYSGD